MAINALWKSNEIIILQVAAKQAIRILIKYWIGIVTTLMIVYRENWTTDKKLLWKDFQRALDKA